MLAYRKLEPAPGLTLKEAEEPIAPGPDEVIVSVQAVGICGSDLHVAQWSDGYDFMRKHLPVTLGHEFAGGVRLVEPASDDEFGHGVHIGASHARRNGSCRAWPCCLG